jgi:dihydrodipicolinate synthase/N-acetylneuraminate lyase
MSGPAEVITAVPTPFTESGGLDLVAARELFGFVARMTGRPGLNLFPISRAF